MNIETNVGNTDTFVIILANIFMSTIIRRRTINFVDVVKEWRKKNAYFSYTSLIMLTLIKNIYSVMNAAWCFRRRSFPWKNCCLFLEQFSDYKIFSQDILRKRDINETGYLFYSLFHFICFYILYMFCYIYVCKINV